MDLIATQNVTLSPQVKTVTFKVRLLHECFNARLSSSPLTGLIRTVSEDFTVAHSSSVEFQTFNSNIGTGTRFRYVNSAHSTVCPITYELRDRTTSNLISADASLSPYISL